MKNKNTSKKNNSNNMRPHTVKNTQIIESNYDLRIKRKTLINMFKNQLVFNIVLGDLIVEIINN